MNKVVTRFPPSPTGYLHIGRARTALFNYLFAKKNRGKMIFRFEDTDKARSQKVFEEIMEDSLRWMGISWDNEVIERQTGRIEIYKRYLKKLVDEDKAYISKEKIEEGDKAGQENEVVRFRNPNKKITFTDMIRGEITFDTKELEDFIIARNIDDPLYHLAVVIDDFEMGITHIIRGDDGISNTPRQILIQQGIGAQQPIYAHLPLILAPDKSKLSGRHGAISVTEYRSHGYLPEALVNYLALLGWNPGTEQEIFSMDELIDAFDLAKVQKNGAIFNIEKLNWFNHEYIKKLDDINFSLRAKDFTPDWIRSDSDQFKKMTPLLKEKCVTLGDIGNLLGAGGELAFVHSLPDYAAELLLWKKNPSREAANKHLAYARETISEIAEGDFSSEKIKSSLWKYAEENGKGDVLWPLRVAVTGQERSPDPFMSVFILGKEESLRRIDIALRK